MEKDGKLNYVLVVNVSHSASLYYYTGYFKNVSTLSSSMPNYLPNNTKDYSLAMKLMFEDEAENMCEILNEMQCSFQYHVEEHIYVLPHVTEK